MEAQWWDWTQLPNACSLSPLPLVLCLSLTTPLLLSSPTLTPLLHSPLLLSFFYPKSISSVKEIRLYLPPGKLKMQADSWQIHLAVKASTSLFNSKVGPEKNSVPRLHCVLRTESPPQIFILMKQPGTHKMTVAVSHSALWQTNKCYGLFSLEQPYTKHLVWHFRGFRYYPPQVHPWIAEYKALVHQISGTYSSPLPAPCTSDLPFVSNSFLCLH